MSETIPALQSMIARNRNILSSLEKMLVQNSFSETWYYIFGRKVKKEIGIHAAHQKALKTLITREYAEERIREFNRLCQLTRNK